MATIEKRGNSYRIKVSCGYDARGKQVTQRMTWSPEPGMTARQIEKELQRQTVLFEEACMQGNMVATVKFEDFAKQWFKEYAEMRLKESTIQGYRTMERRIYKSIGHIRLDKLTTRHIQKFILELCEAVQVDDIEHTRLCSENADDTEQSMQKCCDTKSENTRKGVLQHRGSSETV